MPPRLFHFSEEDGISVFAPRPVTVPAATRPGEEWRNGPLVWAVEERRAATYYFPRECPRILIWPTPSTSPADLARWWGGRECSMIAHVEWDWLERIQRHTLFRYELPASSFRPTSDEWMWVSEVSVVPTAMEQIDDLLGALRGLGVELRVMESLRPLHDVWATSLHASGIRLRNARGWGAD